MIHPHPMHAAFLADIREHPEDDTPRLIYADWLEENREEERAEFIRVQCELASQIPEPALREVWFGGLQNHLNDIPKQAWDNWRYLCKQLRRAGELLKKIEPKYQFVWNWYWRRGFVHTVRCSTALWIQHREKLVRWHPLERVELTNREAVLDADRGVFFFLVAAEVDDASPYALHHLSENLVGKNDSGSLWSNHADKEAATAWLSDRLIARALESAGLGEQGESS